MRSTTLVWIVAAAAVASCSVVNAPEEGLSLTATGKAGSEPQGGGGHAGGGGQAGSGGDCGPTNTLENCGACGTPCAPAQALTPTCLSGTCNYGSCAAGYQDCDGIRTNGCESETASDPNNCGDCGRACADEGFLNVATLVCEQSQCGWQGCAAPFGDCDSNLANGCEQALDTLAECGVCDTPCQPAQVVTAGCVAGVCGYDACALGYQDCDGDTANGCESTQASDPDHCGNCATACDPSETCSAGTCTSCAAQQITVDIPFAQTAGWLATGCCNESNYRQGEGLGTQISASFSDPLATGGTVASVQLQAGVRHACNTQPNAMEFAFNGTLVGTWTSANGPHCDCGNLTIALAQFAPAAASYVRGGANTVAITHQADNACMEAIATVPGAPAGTAFRIVINKTCP